MQETVDYLDLIRRARLGEEGGMDRLAEQVQGRVFVYVLRLTLDESVAEDLCQETIMEMVKSLGRLRLEDARGFWAWVFRTALGKVQHHYRAEQRRQSVQKSMFAEYLDLHVKDRLDDGLSVIEREELFKTILDGIARLKLAYRNVLVLRCFEQMPYAEIAQLLGRKEMHVRVLFYRATHSLRRELALRGYTKSMLLTALGLFGLITGPAKATSTTGTISAALIEVGPAATFAGALCSKLGLMVASLAGALAVVITCNTLIYGAFFFTLGLVLLFCVSIYKAYD
jgi:RNA polymerase sigma-70 factor (ECF subfamily)